MEEIRRNFRKTFWVKIYSYLLIHFGNFLNKFTLELKGFLKNFPRFLYLKCIAIRHEDKKIPIRLAKLWNSWVFHYESAYIYFELRRFISCNLYNKKILISTKNHYFKKGLIFLEGISGNYLGWKTSGWTSIFYIYYTYLLYKCAILFVCLFVCRSINWPLLNRFNSTFF